MGTHCLNNLLKPKRIAIIGASDRIDTVGGVILRNVVSEGYTGTVYPVHPTRESIMGIETHKDVRDIEKDIDLAVIATPIDQLIYQIEACGQKGVKAILIPAPDFRHRVKFPDKILKEIKTTCQKYGIRCLGPNSLGFIRPRLKLNLSTSRNRLSSGRLAFISQSSTLASAILDWSSKKHVGFSTFIALGSQIDIDFADLIDFLGVDPETRGIVLYIDSVTNGRKFISAARAFSRAKPIIVVKGGRFAESAHACFTHTGNLAGEDRVYDAVFKRAGMVRVEEVLDLFHLSEALAKQPTPSGNHLAIITNAGGPALLATDTLFRLGGKLAPLSSDTIEKLNEFLPKHWNPGNPVDLLSDADPERFAKTIEVLLKDKKVEGILVILTSQMNTDPIATAHAITKSIKRAPKKPILATWMGTDEVSKGRNILSENGIPAFVAPEQGIKSFIYMYNYNRNLKLLYETPAGIIEDFQPDIKRVEDIINEAAKRRSLVLGEVEAKQVLQAYDIKSPPVKLARDEKEALEAAKELGFPVALKVESPDVMHRGDVGGVYLHLYEDAIIPAFNKIKENLKKYMPKARFNGVTVHPMIKWQGAELALGAKKDPTFGSVILFGMGGRMIEIVRDYAVGLPPLNETLAKRLIEETKVYKLFKDTTRRPLNLEFMEEVLIRFSQLVIDFPQIREIDINPFYLGTKDGVCLDALIILEDDVLTRGCVPRGNCCPDHLAICPYPCHYIGTEYMKNGKPYTVRPIRPEDEPLLYQLFSELSEYSIRMRFFSPIKEIPHEEMVRYCHVDYDREIALVAEIEEDGQKKIIGVGRITQFIDGESAEMAFVVADKWQGQGVGKTLAKYCLIVAKEKNLKRIEMTILRENKPMIGLAESLGFKRIPSDDPDLVKVELWLK